VVDGDLVRQRLSINTSEVGHFKHHAIETTWRVMTRKQHVMARGVRTADANMKVEN
jgi:hypothetical protein